MSPQTHQADRQTTHLPSTEKADGPRYVGPIQYLPGPDPGMRGYYVARIVTRAGSWRLKKRKKFFLPPSTLDRICFSSLDHKTIYLDSRTSETIRATSFERFQGDVAAVFSFSFIFILTESLKNHIKSQKNHKIKNLILLDSTWVDLHSEHIIWYTLV